MIQTHSHISNASSRQTGFTLVELMIALTLGLFLVGGLIQIYAASSRSAHTQELLADMQGNQRFALDILHREIRMAGFYDQTKSETIKEVPRFYTGSDASKNTQDGTGTNSDRITVQYESTEDCLGNDTTDTKSPNNNPMAVNTFYVNSNTLYCLGNGNPVPQPIAGGVASMQILYGENTDPFRDGVPSTANRYVHLEDANPDPYMSNIVSVRIALLLKSDGALKLKDETETYQLLDASVKKTDRFRYEPVTTTISLRN